MNHVYKHTYDTHTLTQDGSSENSSSLDMLALWEVTTLGTRSGGSLYFVVSLSMASTIFKKRKKNKKKKKKKKKKSL